MKPTNKDYAATVVLMAEVIPYFPTTEVGQKLVIADIRNYIDTVEQLEWFRDAALTRIKKWEGLAGLRELYATRFPLAGAAKQELSPEQAYFEREARETERKLAAMRSLKRLQPANGEHQPFRLSIANAMPPERVERPSTRELERRLLNRGPLLSEEEKARRVREVEAALEQRTGNEGSPRTVNPL
jgi:hypothetical protein